MSGTTSAKYRMSDMIISRHFEDIANRFPEKIAVTAFSGGIAYRDLNEKANRVAHAMNSLGLARQSIAAIYLQSSIQYIVTVLGIMKSGAVFMPLNHQNPVKRLESVLKKTNPSVIITSEQFKDEFLWKLNQIEISYRPDYLFIMNDSFGFHIEGCRVESAVKQDLDYPETNPPLLSEPEDGCYIMTTSGSTGEPKAILGVHKGLSHFIYWEVNEFGLNDHEKVSLLSPVTFDVSLRDIFVPLSTGGTLYIPDEETRTNPRKLTQWLKESGITVVHIIPTLFRLITQEIEGLHQSENFFPDMKYALIAGEVLYWDDIARWQKSPGKTVDLINLYGPSETSLAKLFYRIGHQDSELHEAWKRPSWPTHSGYGSDDYQ